MNDELIDLLDRHNWGDSLIKLTAYVISLCRLRELPSGLEPEDVVMEAIEKVYTGERNWNDQQEPDLHRYLMSVVKSIVSNKFTGKENCTTCRISEGELEIISNFDDAESELYAKQLDTAIAAAMEGDAELCLVYKAIKDGYRQQEIAEEYAIGIGTIRNAKKRLNRLVAGVIEKVNKMKDR